MVEWLAGNRIIGTSTERTTGAGFNPADAVSGGWKEIGRTTLGSANSTIDITSLADKRYLMILANPLPSGTLASALRVGNGSFDSGNNYAIRWSANGGGDSTRGGKNLMALDNVNQTNPQFHVGYIANKSDKEKLTIIHSTGQTSAGAGNAPDRVEQVHKWANTSNVINQIQFLDDTAGTDIGTGSEVVVLGWDPDDTHTTNFWEELASVTLGTDGDVLSSGTFTAKKYLWVQAFIKNSGTSARYNTEMTFNGDTGSNYSERRSLDGSSDATSVNQTKIMNSGVTGSDDDLWCLNMFIINNSANEKLCIGHGFDTYAGSGAGTAPSQRFEKVAKWANTSSQITNITITNSDTSNYDAISELRVWGSN